MPAVLKSGAAPRMLEGKVARPFLVSLTKARPHGDYDEDFFRDVLDVVPAAIYVTDAFGRITYYNEAAADLWGHRPALGESDWCGSWKMYWPDGRALPHGECPMAIAIKEKRIVRGVEVISERPDGSRAPFMPYPTPLFDDSGELMGAVNLLVDISDRKRADEVTQRLAAIVASSDDAIISKDLNGTIESWNKGAERLFGYRPDEVIGRPITILIPEDRQDEEPRILARLRRGESIEQYETVRRRKDGTLVDVSLSISPVHNDHGEIIGAAKTARDTTERRRAAEQQQLLLKEMDHRIRNLFAVASGVVGLSARSTTTTDELASAIQGRLAALGRAHAFTLPKTPESATEAEHPRMLHALIAAITSPHEAPIAGRRLRVRVSGADISVSERAFTSLALLIHEFTTNAAKYGALSIPTGEIDIDCVDGERFVLEWRERGGPRIAAAPTAHGFGSRLALVTVENQLRGELSHDWAAEGLTLRVAIPRDQLTD